MPLQFKVGSKVKFPVPAGVKVTSKDTTIIGVTQQGDSVEATALKAGDAWINATYGGDLQGSVGITVTA